jgi:hypothetical protein
VTDSSLAGVMLGWFTVLTLGQYGLHLRLARIEAQAYLVPQRSREQRALRRAHWRAILSASNCPEDPDF